jgi:ketosteroid isomerase-like protein
MIMANTTYIQFVLTDVTVRVTNDVAVVTCGENMLTDLPADPGALPGEAVAGLAGGRAVATNVFRRSTDGWKLWLHHASPVLTRERPEGES